MSSAKQNQHHGLEAHRLALAAAALSITLVRGLRAPLRSLAGQVVRSASSVPANLAEGAGRRGKDRFHLWRIAYGEARETVSHIQLLIEVGAVDQKRAAEVLVLLDRVCAMTWRLIHPRR